jgi:hypothetical protein
MAEPLNGARKKRAGSLIRKPLSSAGVIYSNIGIYIFAITWIVTVLLGYLGYYQYYQMRGVAVSSSDLLFDTLELFSLKGGDLEWSDGYVLALDIARWTALIVTFWAVALIMSRAFLGPLHRLRLWLCSDHVIVCGMGRIGSRFAKALSEDYQVVVIDKDQGKKIDDELKGANVVNVQGNATEDKVLRRAGIGRAKYLITALGDDSANAEIAIQARMLVKGRSRDPITCFVHVLDPELCEVLRVNEFNAGSPSLRLEFYNVFENSARIILNEFPAFEEAGIGTRPSARILIIGLDDLGQALVLRAAKRWWPRYQATNQRLSLILVDADVNTVLGSMCARHPSLVSACSFEPIAMDVRKVKVAKDEELNWLRSDPTSGIYICAPNDSDGLSLALMLRKRIGNEGAPIVVRMNADSTPAALIGEEGRNAGLSNVHTFGFWDRTCTKALIQHGSREIMGQAIHEEYCLEQKARGTITEASKMSWDGLSEELRESNRSQADHIIVKAKAIGCNIDALTDWGSDPYSLTPYEVHKLSRMEHDRWCREKTKKGWRYGKVRDDAMKVHDDLIPWNELSADAKYKDIATVKKIPRTLARVDLRLTRKDMALLVAKALLIDKLSRAKQKSEGDIDVSSAWREMPDTERASYLDEANTIIECIGEIDCDLSGRGSVDEEIGALTTEESERANSKFRDLMAEKGEGSHSENASRWPGILSRVDIAIYRFEDARKLVERDREAMMLAFSTTELDEPFVPR